MPTVRLLEKTGKDGILHLEIPLGQPEVEFEAIVVLQPKAVSSPAGCDPMGWPTNYFEQTFGSISDETFARQPQGVLGKPVDLE